MNTTTLKLQVDNIHKRFGANEVLKGVSLTAHAGDVISIIGSSGSGKSTFLRCINLLEKPNQGRITVAGEELHLNPDSRGELHAANPKQLARLRTKLAMLVFVGFNTGYGGNAGSTSPEAFDTACSIFADAEKVWRDRGVALRVFVETV